MDPVALGAAIGGGAVAAVSAVVVIVKALTQPHAARETMLPPMRGPLPSVDIDALERRIAALEQRERAAAEAASEYRARIGERLTTLAERLRAKARPRRDDDDDRQSE